MHYELIAVENTFIVRLIGERNIKAAFIAAFCAANKLRRSKGYSSIHNLICRGNTTITIRSRSARDVEQTIELADMMIGLLPEKAEHA